MPPPANRRLGYVNAAALCSALDLQCQGRVIAKHGRPVAVVMAVPDSPEPATAAN